MEWVLGMQFIALPRRGIPAAGRPYLSPYQAGFSDPAAGTEFNCFWGLQSVFKPLSIYTVVLLDDHRRSQQWKPIKSKRWKLH